VTDRQTRLRHTALAWRRAVKTDKLNVISEATRVYVRVPVYVCMCVCVGKERRGSRQSDSRKSASRQSNEGGPVRISIVTNEPAEEKEPSPEPEVSIALLT